MSITAILTYFRRIILMSVILMVSTKAMAATTLNFRAPDSGPVPSYVTALLEEAYAELGN